MKQSQQALPSSSQPRSSKREKRRAQWPKRPEGEQSSIKDDVVNDPSPTDIQQVPQ